MRQNRKVFLLQVAIASWYTIAYIHAEASSSSPSKPVIQRIKKNVQKANRQVRKAIQVSNLWTPTSSLDSYERILSTPAFAVTTSWGSPYMIFERLSRKENAVEDEVDRIFGSNAEFDKKVLSTLTDRRGDEAEDDEGQESQRTRATALYFTDPEDALHLCDEMKQMGGGMATADIRVMSTTLGRAVRQASVLGRGLPTGQPVDNLTGRLRSDQGTSLRYKMVPSRRELFYAARCFGKERVGLFADRPSDDAKLVLTGRKPMLRDRIPSKKSKEEDDPSGTKSIRKTYAHMNGKTGVPLFYIHGLEQNVPTLKSKFLLNAKNKRAQIPLFFSYEDCITAYRKIQNKATPVRPPQVEVFNFVDVIVAMDKEQSKSVPSASPLTSIFKKQSNEVDKPKNPNAIDLLNVVFIPSSKALKFKETSSTKGNGKARLRPMRDLIGMG